jgi:ribosome biogenesis GTPase
MRDDVTDIHAADDPRDLHPGALSHPIDVDFAPQPIPDTLTDLPGLVVKTHSGFYTVQTDAQPAAAPRRVVCQLRGTLKQGSKKTELCVIGDRVLIDVSSDGRGSIKRVLPRQRALSRVEPSEYAGKATEREQVLIANPDQTIFVFAAAKPTPNHRVLDRYLVAAEKADIPHIAIVVNKSDLPEADAARELFGMYAALGYAVLFTSVKAGAGLDPLRALLAGKISAFTGPSGVGKSSLLNAIQPGLGQAVGEVSEKLTKGKHTTVNAELIALEGEDMRGGYVADTPGIRAFAPWDVEPGELDGYFREFGAFVPDCVFSDCTHMGEPGCAVRAAVERGQIAALRYDSYLRLREELEEQYVY